MSAKLKQLQAVRSRLADDIIAFCDAAITHLDATPYHCKVDGETVAVTISGTVIDAKVYTEHCAMEAKPDASNKRGLQADEEPASQNDHERRHAELNGDPMNIAGREAIPWTRALQRAQRGRPLVVLGAPGRGKTTLTRHATVQRLTAVRDGLAGHTLRPEDGEPMLWTTCTVLAGTPLRGNDPADLVVRAAFAALGLPENVPAASLRVRHWLRGRLADGSCAVALDSLDEVPERKRAAFRNRAHRLRHLVSPLILTCRSHDWEQREDVPWPHLIEVKLAPFRRREQSAFVRRFFREEIRPRASARPQNADLSGALERELSRNVSLRRMCASPILLFFTCLLHANEPWPQRMLRRTEIYESMCSRLFRGTWRGEAKPPPWADGDRREGEVTAWLAEVALALFRAAPEAKEFSLAAWKNAVLSEEALHVASRGCPRGRKSKAEHQIELESRAGKLLDQLVECGLFVPLGKRHGQPHYVWPHRSFLAYFAGKALAARPREIWLGEVIGHLWFEAPWEDVLLFLAGHLDEEGIDVVLAAVGTEPEDIYRRRLCWQWRLAGEARIVSGRWGEEWAKATMALIVNEGAFCPAEAARTELLALLGSIITSATRVADSMDMLFDPFFGYERSSVAEALGRMGGQHANELLYRHLDPHQEDDESVRAVIAEALGNLGDETSVELLARSLDVSYEADCDVRRQAAESLGKIGSPRAIEKLAKILDGKHEPDNKVRESAAKALGAIENQQAADVLFRSLDPTFEFEKWVGWQAAKALGRIGGNRIVGRLIERVASRNAFGSKERAHAASSLGIIGDERAIEVLLDVLDPKRESDDEVRASAVAALGWIGSQRATDALLQCLNTECKHFGTICCNALFALANIGGERAIDALLHNLDPKNQKNTDFRKAAARGLGKIGSEVATEALLQSLEPLHEASTEVRVFAAEALGKIGSERAVDALSRCLDRRNEGHPSVRLNAARALGNILGEQASEALLQILRSGQQEEDYVISGIVETLGRIGNEGVVNELKKLRSSSKYFGEVRVAIDDALFRLYWRVRSRQTFILPRAGHPTN